MVEVAQLDHLREDDKELEAPPVPHTVQRHQY
jgi:hypothetical protein